MIRVMDASGFNAVCNHPDVRPWIGGEGPIELSSVLEDVGNYGLWFDGGGFVVTAHGGGDYECHSMFLPDARRGIRDAVKAALSYMFCETDCLRIVSRFPDGNDRAAALGKIAGFVPTFRGAAVSFGEIGAEAWALRSSACQREGEAFHGLLHDAKRAAGSILAEHADDPAHDRIVGAAILMVKAGNTNKAVWFYNRWARVSGYAQVALLSEKPPVVDILDAVMTLTNGQLEVLKCR